MRWSVHATEHRADSSPHTTAKGSAASAAPGLALVDLRRIMQRDHAAVIKRESARARGTHPRVAGILAPFHGANRRSAPTPNAMAQIGNRHGVITTPAQLRRTANETCHGGCARPARRLPKAHSRSGSRQTCPGEASCHSFKGCQDDPSSVKIEGATCAVSPLRASGSPISTRPDDFSARRDRAPYSLIDLRRGARDSGRQG